MRTMAGELPDRRMRSSIGTGVGGVRFFGDKLHRRAQDRAHGRDHVGSLRHQDGTLLEQVVAPLRTRIQGRAGHGEHFAALLERKPRRDQGARALGGLHDDDADRQARNQPVAAGKIARAGLPPKRHFRDQRALGEDRRGQIAVLGRVDFDHAPRRAPPRCR